MKFSFPVIVKKTAATDIGECILIPSLGISKILLYEDKLQIANIGLKSYLEQCLLTILQAKSAENEYIELPKMMDTLLDQFVNKDGKVNLGNHDLILTVAVEFEVKATRRCFSKFLPPLMKLTILIELTAGMILSIGTLQLTENSIIPMNAEATTAVSITQSALSTLLGLWISWSGPGMAFIKHFGNTLDDGLNKLCSKKIARSPVEEQPQSNEGKSCSATRAKIRFVQGIFLLLVVNNLWTNITMDYQQIRALRATLDNNKNSLFPEWIISTAAYTAFGSNQFNDPVMFISLVKIGFDLIKAYYTKDEPILASSTSQVNHRNALYSARSASSQLLANDELKDQTISVKVAASPTV